MVAAGGPAPTLTFTLIAPDGSAVYTETQTVTGDADYTTTGTGTGSEVATQVGTYFWNVSYSGNAFNNGVSHHGSNDTNEQLTTVKASPSIVTTAHPTGTVNVGDTAITVSDSAVLSNGYNETGSLVFSLHLGNSTGTTVYTTSVKINGNGTYSASTMLPPSSPVGTYTWTVTYAGDALNYGANDQGGPAEQFAIQNVVAKNDAATMGFWANNNGQALLKTYGSALGNWLASAYGNLFGNLNGATGTQVAAYFITAKTASGGLIGNTYAQALTTALDVWVTTTGLGWNTSSSGPTKFGFQQGFGGAGLGSILYNVGNNGASFGVANNSYLTVSQILAYLNSKTYITTAGSLTKLPKLYFYGSTDTTWTNGANNVLNGINQQGDIT
jgi:hypothetical protein